MIRLVGAVFVFCGACWIGLRKTLDFMQQISQLRHLFSAMEIVQCELNYTMYSVPKILEIVSNRVKGPCGAYFKNLSDQITMGTPREIAAQRAIENTPKLMLPSDALLALLEFSTSLGSYDLDGENRICKLSNLRVGQALERLEKDKRPLVKSYLVLGASTGIALVILML